MRFSVPRGAVCAAILIVGFLLGHAWSAREPMARGERAADDPVKPVAAARPDNGTKAYSAPPDVHLHLLQSPGVRSQRPPSDYGLGPNHVSKLPPYPPGGAGVRTPFDLWRYAGKQGGSIGNPRLPMTFEEWLSFHREQKPQLMEAVRQYMNGRFDFSGDALPGATMSGGKPIMKGPIARLPEGVESWESLSAMTPEQIREKDIFPYTPLAHPLHTTAHMLFPGNWVRAHPEHRRIDVDFDIPEEYLPEFPPPLFLSTHKELGDVSGGVEITLGNYFETFDGLLTGEQLEGLKELLRPTATTWFNHTTHRVTEQPSAGVACFSCHVNGHTNGAIELAPDTRPNQSRLRVDTPTLRGNYNLMLFSSKRSIRSMDHFAEVEEYFDGDVGGLGQPIGLANRQRQLTNRMGDFNAIIDFPPAPKLGPLMRLIPSLCSEQELRGEGLFHGKAQCYRCHYGPAFVDEYQHDLRVERFYVGRPEGPIKTFALRGIKDSPPYLHDGRCMTLQDAVEFFNLVLELKLTSQEKEDLVAYLLCL
ncbi:MAG: cytochrome C [Phycisphaerae bacterium]|nr:cytochrome C [Phycisphaerae bacterium]NUQ46616.1 cytochrome C [Phycisphaerae bacterium]